MNPDSYLSAIRSDADRLAACAATGDLAAPIAACPGWDLRALVDHTGGVHRWAAAAARSRAAPATPFQRPDPEADGAELARWLHEGAAHLTDVLAAASPDSDTWHPFPVEQRAWVWRRRQAHETAMHRWDAEVATTGTSDLDAALAADGLTEFFDMLLPRVLLREQRPAPAASLHVHCTDAELPEGAGEWIVWGDGGEYRMEAVHRKGDAALRGSADELLLALMGRTDGSDLDLVGDGSAAAAWFELPGL